MQILVLGATGGCGRWFVELAVRRGHRVTAVARPRTDYEPPDGALLERGEVLEPGFVRSTADAMERGPDAIACCLGSRRAGVWPWAPLLSPQDFMERAMSEVVEAARAHPKARLLWISAGGVGDSRSHCSQVIRSMIDLAQVGRQYADLGRAEARVTASGVAALAVRPVTLLHGPPTGRAGHVDRYGFFSMIRRSDVAEWMLDVVDGTRSHDAPTVLLGRSPGR